MTDCYEVAAYLDRCEQEASSLYQLVVRQALDRYHYAIAMIPDPKNTPRFDRAKAAAWKKYEEISLPAWKLRNLALRDLMLTGEVSAAVDEAMTRLRDSQIRMETAA